MATPIGKGDVIAGYAIAFALVAVVQAVVLTFVTVGLLGMNVRGSLWVVMLVAVLDAILGATLGLAASALARTEFQAVQMMPVILFPQLITCGLFMPRAVMPGILESISRVLPLTYGVDALQRLAVGATFVDVRSDVLVILGFIALAVVVGATTLRRRTP
jgi:ABC-2 type transport system permease protein